MTENTKGTKADAQLFYDVRGLDEDDPLGPLLIREHRERERERIMRALVKLWKNRYGDKSLVHSEIADFIKKQGGDPRKLGDEP